MTRFWFVYKKSCSTCRKARAFLVDKKPAPEFPEFDERDMSAKPLSAAEIDALIGERDHVPFLNFRNELYREKKMKLNPPSRAETVKLMAKEPNLIRRPLLIDRKRGAIVYGFDADEFDTMLKG